MQAVGSDADQHHTINWPLILRVGKYNLQIFVLRENDRYNFIMLEKAPLPRLHGIKENVSCLNKKIDYYSKIMNRTDKLREKITPAFIIISPLTIINFYNIIKNGKSLIGGSGLFFPTLLLSLIMFYTTIHVMNISAKKSIKSHEEKKKIILGPTI